MLVRSEFDRVFRGCISETITKRYDSYDFDSRHHTFCLQINEFIYYIPLLISIATLSVTIKIIVLQYHIMT